MKTLLVPYDPNWPALFEAEATRLRRAFGSLAVRSTITDQPRCLGSPPNRSLTFRYRSSIFVRSIRIASRLKRSDTSHVPHPDDAFCPFFHRPTQWPHTHHVHVVQAGGEEERRTLAFRDYLRRHDDVAREYEQLKHRLMAELNPNDHASREAYARGRPSLSNELSRSPWRPRRRSDRSVHCPTLTMTT